jgi:outer membrane protein assembly factor BamB
VILIALVVDGAVLAAQSPSAAYSAASAKIQAGHRDIALKWYSLLDRTAPASSILRLQIPRFTGGATLDVEFPLAEGLARRGVAFVRDKQIFACVCDAANVSLGGAIKGTLTVVLPAECESGPAASKRIAESLVGGRDGARTPGEPEELTIAIDATASADRVTGTFACAAAKTKGSVTGQIVKPSEAAAGLRNLPAIDAARMTPAGQYFLAIALERDAFELYRSIRALTAAGGERGKYAASLAADAIPIPRRPAFVKPAAAPAPSPAPAPVHGGKRPAPRPPSKGPSIDDVTGDSPPPAAQPDDVTVLEQAARARLPVMDAMAATVAALAGVVAQSDGPAPAVERGRTFDDPLFGPWYGATSLAAPDDTVNRLPADAGSPGVQDWPFVHAWQFLGPFDFPPASWDPLRLPDCVATADTQYDGSEGPVHWQPATVNASNCAVFTDVDAYSESPEIDETPDSPTTRRSTRMLTYYGVATIEAQADTQLFLAAGCAGRMSIWIDGALVARGPASERPDEIPHEALIFPAKLHRGTNRVLVRCQTPAYGLFTHRRPGTASYFWMRACVRGSPADAQVSRAQIDKAAARKKDLPNLPPNVRGYRHDQTGFFAQADPPTAWDIDKGINVRWSSPIERWSKASPLVVGDKVLICAEPHVLVCLDALTGKALWRRTANVLELINPALATESEKLHQEYLDARAAVAPRLSELGPDYAARLRALAAQGRELPRAVADLRAMERDADKKYAAFYDHLRANAKPIAPAWDGHFSGPWLGYTFATPVTDGQRVFVQFRTGATAAFDLDGKRLWMVHTPYETGGVGVCSSPVLADDKLVISQSLEPKRAGALVILRALDAATGRALWSARADSRSQTSSPVVMRLTNGRDDMTVIVTDGGTVVRADDGKVLVTGLRGGSGTGSPTPVGDALYRVENAQGGAVQLVMLDRDHVGAKWLWSVTGLYNAIYAGVGHHEQTLFGTCHGGSQCISARGLDLISASTGQPIDRPFNQDARKLKQGIFAVGRFGFVPPVASPRAIYIAVKGQGHASSLQEELPDRWTPYTYVTVAQHGALGRFLAHNKVVGPLTPHVAMAGDRLYLRNDQELLCVGYTGDEGRAYEAQVNAATILADIPDQPPADPQAAALWRQGIAHARPFLQRVIALSPSSEWATRAKALLSR